jgi:hypothetical protein
MTQIQMLSHMLCQISAGDLELSSDSAGNFRTMKIGHDHPKATVFDQNTHKN